LRCPSVNINIHAHHCSIRFIIKMTFHFVTIFLYTWVSFWKLPQKLL
jgi:hypothetical protein